MMTKLKTSQQETTAVSPVEVDGPKWEWPVKVLESSGRVKEVLMGPKTVGEVVKGFCGKKRGF